MSDNTTLNAALEDLADFQATHGLIATCMSAKVALMNYPEEALPLFYSDPSTIPKPAGGPALAAYTLMMPFLRARGQAQELAADRHRKRDREPSFHNIALAIVQGLNEALGQCGDPEEWTPETNLPENLPQPKETMKPHPHAHILRYLADGGDFASIEYVSPSGKVGQASPEGLIDGVQGTYRIKPPTMEFNGQTLPMPERVAPVKGARYWVPIAAYQEAHDETWTDHELDRRNLKLGLVHLNRAAAQQWLAALTPFKS